MALPDIRLAKQDGGLWRPRGSVYRVLRTRNIAARTALVLEDWNSPCKILCGHQHMHLQTRNLILVLP